MALFEVNFFSEVLGMEMSMNVVIPQKTRGNIGVTEGDTGDRIPVLWLLHGMSDDHTTWLRRTSVERYAEEKGLAVVMPTTYLGWYTDMYTGYNYRTFIGEELPKIVQNMFPALSDRREDNYIAGNSMGGYGSLALAFTYPEQYAIAAPLSGAFDPKWLYDPKHPEKTYFTDIYGKIEDFDGSKNDLYALSKNLKESGKPMPKIFIWCGTEDFLFSENQRMRDHLVSIGWDLTYTQTPGNHSWGYWDREIRSILNFIDNYRKGI